jgi:hypothetical protein
MIDPAIITQVDFILDSKCSAPYQEQPYAQHWARVAKIIEEGGEAVSELIIWTGQNPRKPQDDNAYDRMLQELADAALTGIYAIQHFTKDAEQTENILRATQAKHLHRLTHGN